ncbi:MAG TPA: hypothetical protein VEU31_08055 [Candidatus Acidoferrales bacterium]|nr:hypothetical protein [Candidatus Acidoferrales bacterium]
MVSKHRIRNPFQKGRAALFTSLLTCATLLLAGGLFATGGDGEFHSSIPNLKPFHDPSGELSTFTTQGSIDTNNPFFQDLGTNGRRCVTCHQASDAWTVTPPHIRERFEDTDGTDPIFRTNDGSTCPSNDVSTLEARRKAYSLLLNKGLIRIELSVPAGAEFTVANNDNPYGCTSLDDISVYRRPLPSTNLGFLSTVMWDGRETFKNPDGTFKSITFDLSDQAVGATLGHAQAVHAPTPDQVHQIVDFETALFTAQFRDNEAGLLDAHGARGGPVALSQQPFFIGINDPLGLNPTGAPFSSTIFTLFEKWLTIPDSEYNERTEARRSIARGEQLFNTLPIPITGVGGLNDALKVPVIHGFCGTCHDTPNAGDHSVSAPLNIGISDASRRTPDLPLITLRNIKTGELIQTMDPGRALISGKWADIGKTKGPILRGLAGRAPYFHNGSAATLGDVVDFYVTRFNLNLSERDKDDLVAFLKTL